ncbi:hypothetical protein GCM10009758_01980 [Microbacterium hatanonis]
MGLGLEGAEALGAQGHVFGPASRALDGEDEGERVGERASDDERVHRAIVARRVPDRVRERSRENGCVRAPAWGGADYSGEPC